MEQSVLDDLKKALEARGPAAAIDELCERLRREKDYRTLFYALLMKRRHALGASPFATGPAADLPPELHAAYEEAIREAGREIGNLYLLEGNIPESWFYFRMIGEVEPVARALEAYTPRDEDDLQSLIQLAFYEGLQPRKGFDWVIDRYGLCNAITTMSSQELPHPPEIKQYCIGRLVRTLYQELRERLLADIERTEGKPVPHDADRPTVRELLAGRETLFADGFAHIDVSHLGAVVQMAVHLPPGEELDLARQLCDYGKHIPQQLRYHADPPFDDQYADYGVYLAILAGDKVEEGLAHFRAKADNADPETIGTYPAEVLVNLLLRLDRPREALEVARKHLVNISPRQLSCPSIVELCQRCEDYNALAEIAHSQGDALHYLAGLLAGAQR